MVSFETEGEAREELERARLLAGDRGVESATEAFLKAKEAEGLKAATLTTNRHRLRSLLRLNEGDRSLVGVTARLASDLYTRRVAENAADTHQAELSLAKALWEWCCRQGWVAGNVWAEVEPKGQKRSRPKDKIRVDEARKLLRVALAEDSPEGTAVAMALLLGLRATEVTSRVVRDLDDAGRLLWVPCSKTPAGVRQVKVPAVLRTRLLLLTEGQKATSPLWGVNQRGKPCDRHWLEHHCLRLCIAAKVPEVRPHALRGLHATLATINGVAVDAVARALGHASPKVTRDHYLTPGTEADVASEAISERLSTG